MVGAVPALGAVMRTMGGAFVAMRGPLRARGDVPDDGGDVGDGGVVAAGVESRAPVVAIAPDGVGRLSAATPRIDGAGTASGYIAGEEPAEAAAGLVFATSSVVGLVVSWCAAVKPANAVTAKSAAPREPRDRREVVNISSDPSANYPDGNMARSGQFGRNDHMLPSSTGQFGWSVRLVNPAGQFASRRSRPERPPAALLAGPRPRRPPTADAA